MKKKYVVPVAKLIELQMKENIATSPGAGNAGGDWYFTDTEGPGICWDSVQGVYDSLYHTVKETGEPIRSAEDMISQGFGAGYSVQLLLDMKMDLDKYYAVEIACTRT